MIELKSVSKQYKIAIKEKGLKGALKSIFKRKYKIVDALKNVSFKIEEGEIVGYIGPNGAGKSTTIKIMCGILAPTSGECVIDGYIPYKQRKEYVKNIGAVFGQRSNLSWDLPIIDSYELLKEIYKIPKEIYDKNLEKLTKILGLGELLNVPPRQMSLGQRMKSELAGALLHNPKILFLDEPTIGLDSTAKLAVRDMIKKINAEMKVTIILTTHDMNDIEALTNRIILIGKGQLLYDGSFEEIKKRFKNHLTIQVELYENTKDFSLDGYEVISNESGVVKLKPEQTTKFNIVEFTKSVYSKYDVRDIDVHNLNLEEIIYHLYKEYDVWEYSKEYLKQIYLKNCSIKVRTFRELFVSLPLALCT